MSSRTSDLYEGPYNNGKREGEGTYYFKSGNVYQGTFLANKRHGFGRLTFANGEFMEGTWSEGCITEGYFMYLNGNYYQGPFKNNLFTTGGKFYYKESDLTYIGEFSNNQFSGQGDLKWESTNIFYYRGGFSKDKFHGPGVLYLPNSNVSISAEWDMGNTRGIAEISENNVPIYKVALVNMKKHGFGDFFQEEAGKWGKGRWENDSLVEISLYHYSDTKLIQGKFDKNLTGNGEYSGNGDFYKGNFVNGKKQGQGRLIYSNKDIYEGLFFNDQRHGKGVYRFAEGIEESLEGEWENGKLTGNGTLIYKDKSILKGTWFRGNKKQGKIVFSNRDEFEGNFIGEEAVVNGVYKFYEGDSYEGPLLDWKKDGQAKYFFKDGSCIEGYWENDLLEFTARVIFADGSVLEGTFVNGILDGIATFHYKVHEKYKRFKVTYENGRVFGKGAFLMLNGQEKEFNLKIWEDEGRIEYKNGEYWYKGGWKDNMKHGEGVEGYENKDVYTGSFENGLRSGAGNYVFADGASYEGNFKKGEFDGLGLLKYPNGDYYEGSFENSKRSGNGTYFSNKVGYVTGLWINEGREVQV